MFILHQLLIRFLIIKLSINSIIVHCSHLTQNSGELVNGSKEKSLSLSDLLPIPPNEYDKNRAPKLLGQPTVVYFHVTVLSLDSINEESMVRTIISHLQLLLLFHKISVLDLCNGHFPCTVMA